MTCRNLMRSNPTKLKFVGVPRQSRQARVSRMCRTIGKTHFQGLRTKTEVESEYWTNSHYYNDDSSNGLTQ
jgi:hypothetical protein